MIYRALLIWFSPLTYRSWVLSLFWLLFIYRSVVTRKMSLETIMAYGVATIIRLLKTIGLFCKRALLKRLCSAKESYNFIESTNRCQPISLFRRDFLFNDNSCLTNVLRFKCDKWIISDVWKMNCLRSVKNEFLAWRFWRYIKTEKRIVVETF